MSAPPQRSSRPHRGHVVCIAFSVWGLRASCGRAVQHQDDPSTPVQGEQGLSLLLVARAPLLLCVIDRNKGRGHRRQKRGLGHSGD